MIQIVQIQEKYIQKIMYFIGNAQNCLQPCMEYDKKKYSKIPHVGPHEDSTLVDLIKKSDVVKIATFGNLIAQYQAQLVEEINKFMVCFKNMVANQLQRILCKGLVADVYNDKSIADFRKFAAYQYDDLSCHNVWQIFKNVNSSIRNRDLQQRGEQFIKQFKTKIQHIYGIFESKQNLIPSKMQIDKIGPSKIESNDNFWKENDEVQQQPLSMIITEKIGSIPKKSESKLSLQDDELNFYQKSFFQKKKQEIIKQIQINGDQQQLSVTDINDSAYQMDFYESQCNKKEQVAGLSVAKSYIDDMQAKVYTQVQRLNEAKYRNSKQRFNIKLKVIQQLCYKINRIQVSPQKIINFKKIKFLAGDETGVVVCFTNAISEIKKDQYINLTQCKLNLYNHTSLQIQSNKCRSFQPEKPFKVNFKVCISKLDSLDPIIYSLQRTDHCWPSIRGLAYLNFEKCTKIQLIATVSVIVYEGDHHYECYIYDGTGKIYAYISKQESIKLEEGKNYYFRKLHVVVNKLGKQDILAVKTNELSKSDIKKYAPVIFKDFKYDDELNNIAVVQYPPKL